jgi:perosamine synthetase
VADLYSERLASVVRLPSLQPGAMKSWFVYVVCLPVEYTREQRDWILARLVEKRIGCNNYFPPIHLQPFYRKTFGYREGDFPVTEMISKRTIALPFHNNLQKEEIDYVTDTFTGLLAVAGFKEPEDLACSA